MLGNALLIEVRWHFTEVSKLIRLLNADGVASIQL